MADALNTLHRKSASQHYFSPDDFDGISAGLLSARTDADFKDVDAYVRSLRGDFSRLPEGELRDALDAYLTLVGDSISRAKKLLEQAEKIGGGIRQAERKFWQAYRAAGGPGAVDRSLVFSTMRAAMSLPKGSSERRALLAALRG